MYQPPSGLTCLHNDVLAMIAAFDDMGTGVLNLWKSGDTLLQLKLTHSVTRFELHDLRLATPIHSWPLICRQLTQLKEVAIVCPHANMNTMLSIRQWASASKIQSLTLKTANLERTLILNEFIYLPQLTTLKMSAHLDFPILPSTLTELESRDVGHSAANVSLLPRSLQRYTCVDTSARRLFHLVTQTDISLLPPALVSYRLPHYAHMVDFGNGDYSLLSHMPKTIAELSLRFSSFTHTGQFCLPPAVTQLRIATTFQHDRCALPIWQAIQQTPTLEHLDLQIPIIKSQPMTPSEWVNMLSRRLKTLILHQPPVNWQQGDNNTSYDWPQTLQLLDIAHPGWYIRLDDLGIQHAPALRTFKCQNMRFPSHVPAWCHQLETLQLDALHCRFDKYTSLTSLNVTTDITNCRKWTVALPSTLTHMSVSFNGHDRDPHIAEHKWLHCIVPKLPSTLQSFEINCRMISPSNMVTIHTPLIVQLLPRALKLLSLTLEAQDGDDWSGLVSALPPALESLTLHREPSIRHTAEFPSLMPMRQLPTTLKSFEFYTGSSVRLEFSHYTGSKQLTVFKTDAHTSGYDYQNMLRFFPNLECLSMSY